MKIRPSTLFASAASAIVVATIAVGLVISGSPAQVRIERLDEQRVRDLQLMSSSIESYATFNGNLPDSIEKAHEAPGWQFVGLKDAESGMPYEYKVVDRNTYELCAEFKAASNDQAINQRWKHPPGKYCFSLQARVRPQPG